MKCDVSITSASQARWITSLDLRTSLFLALRTLLGCTTKNAQIENKTVKNLHESDKYDGREYCSAYLAIRRAHLSQSEFICEVCARHCVGKVLLVGKDEDGCVTEFVFLQLKPPKTG